jgi:orotate phosphoribosyltransferase-like protein
MYFDLLKAYFETNSLVIVPAHGTVENNLQKNFGSLIKRIAEVSPRKYNHKHPLDKDYAFSYQIDFAKIRDKKVILIDDIVTSGETINHFAEVLQTKGYEVIKFGIGLSHKLTFEKLNSFYLAKS